MNNKQKVVIFGGGIAGLSTAHYLSKNPNYDITIYEQNENVGGFFRSSRNNDGDFSEYSWHGLYTDGWYQNIKEIMSEIPYEDEIVMSKVVQKDIHFHILPNTDKNFSIPSQLNSPLQKLKFLYIMSKVFVANKRSNEVYSKQLAADIFYSTLNKESAHNFLSISGPFIGADWIKVSYHHIGCFFRRSIFSNKNYLTSNKSWKLLGGPSSEVLFDPWVKHLENNGVKFQYNSSIVKLDIIDNKITTATICSQKNQICKVQADIYVIATNPFSVSNVVKNSSPEIAKIEELNKMSQVILDGPHSQIAFFIAFTDEIKFPSPQYAVILRDSPYNITFTAVEQFWLPTISLGKDIKSLWTCTVCVGTRINGLNGKPADLCTKQEFINEVLNQIRSNKNLEEILKQYNSNKGFDDFKIKNIDVWNEWTFDPINGIKPKQPKWVNSNTNQHYRSTQKTSVPNLFLAGAHTITDADIWSIEGAAESGKKVSSLINKENYISTDYKPIFIKTLNKLDDVLYDAKLPNIIDILLILIVIVIIILFLIRFSI